MTAQAIQDLREMRSVSIDELAKVAGMTPARLGAIERGEAKPTPQEIMDVALCLDVPTRLLDGYQPYRADNDDFEYVRTILGHLDLPHDFDLVITWPGGISRRYPVDDMARDLFECDPDETLAFKQIQTLDNRMLLIANTHEHTVAFLPPEVRSDIPARKPFSIALVEGIKDIAYDQEPSAVYSPRYADELSALLATIPEGSDAYARFLENDHMLAGGDRGELDIEERIGAMIDYAACLERGEPLFFDFDDGYGDDIVVDLTGYALIDVPLADVVDEWIDSAEQPV